LGYATQKVADTIPGVDKLVSAGLDATNFIDRTIDNNYKGLKGSNAISSLGTPFINEKRISPNEFVHQEVTQNLIVSPYGGVISIPVMSLKSRKDDKVPNNVQGVYVPPHKQSFPVKDNININLGTPSYNPVKMNSLQENRKLQQNFEFQNPSSIRNSITVHNNNKFTTTINGDNRSPQRMYNDFMSTVNKQISNLTSEFINLYKTGK